MAGDRDVWRAGLGDELGFWRAWVEGKGLDWPHDFAARFDASRELSPWLRRLVEPMLAPGEVARVLDVGAGPATTLGAVWPGRGFELIAVDPLADEYARVLGEAGLSAPVPTRRASAEELAAVFGPASFHLVHCKNALDHTADPVAALRGMAEVTRVGGCVRLEHARREAETQRYAGLHQWNLDAEPVSPGSPTLRLIAWSREARVDLGAVVGAEPGPAGVGGVVAGAASERGATTIEVELPQDGWVRATIRVGGRAAGAGSG